MLTCNYRDYAYKHCYSLQEVVDGRGHVAARYYIYRGQHCHQQYADGVVDVERHAEQSGQAVVQRSGVGNKEYEDYYGRADLERRGLKTLGEELRHGLGVQVLGHDAGAPAQDDPRKQGADDGVAQAYPCRRNAVFPAELACVTYEYDRGEIRSAVRECCKPGANGASAEHESVHVRGVLAAVETYCHHYAEVDYQ